MSTNTELSGSSDDPAHARQFLAEEDWLMEQELDAYEEFERLANVIADLVASETATWDEAGGLR